MEERLNFVKWGLKEHFQVLDGELSMDSVSSQSIVEAAYSEEIKHSQLESVAPLLDLSKKYTDITFGQMILIEQVLASRMAYCDKIVECLALFFRPPSEEVFSNDDEGTESNIRILISCLNVKAQLHLFSIFSDMREDFFFKRYKDVIYSETHGGSKTNEMDAAFSKVFGWYEKQKLVASELRMGMSEVLDIPVTEAMMELAYQKAKYTLESNKQKFKK